MSTAEVDPHARSPLRMKKAFVSLFTEPTQCGSTKEHAMESVDESTSRVRTRRTCTLTKVIIDAEPIVDKKPVGVKKRKVTAGKKRTNAHKKPGPVFKKPGPVFKKPEPVVKKTVSVSSQS